MELANPTWASREAGWPLMMTDRPSANPPVAVMPGYFLISTADFFFLFLSSCRRGERVSRIAESVALLSRVRPLFLSPS